MFGKDNMSHAQQVYRTLCNTLDRLDWKYNKEKEDLLVHFGVNGDKMPIKFIITVDEERKLIRLASPLPFKMSEQKRVEGAIAACAASYGMADGNFDYDVSEGEIVFRSTASFSGSNIGEELFRYMLHCAYTMVNKYNIRFLSLDKGIIDFTKFLSDKD